MQAFFAGLALSLALAVASAAARPFTVDDLLKVETLGGAYLARRQLRWTAVSARAKAVIAWKPDTNEVRSGQLQAPPAVRALAAQVRRCER
jgi:hypothetical protein